MTTSFAPSRHVACHYNRTGAELLHLLRCEFDHPALNSIELDELVAEPACDLAGESLKPLAGQLAPSGLQLWEIDFFEDTVHVTLVTEDQVTALVHYWSVDYPDEPDAVHFKPRLRHIKAKEAKGKRAEEN